MSGGSVRYACYFKRFGGFHPFGFGGVGLGSVGGAVFEELLKFAWRRVAVCKFRVNLRDGGIGLFEAVFGVAGGFLQGAAGLACLAGFAPLVSSRSAFMTRAR